MQKNRPHVLMIPGICSIEEQRQGDGLEDKRTVPLSLHSREILPGGCQSFLPCHAALQTLWVMPLTHRAARSQREMLLSMKFIMGLN